MPVARFFCAAAIASLTLAAGGNAVAQSCSLDEPPTFQFGRLNHHGTTDTTGDFRVSCRAGNRAAHFNVCAFVGGQSVNPRIMTGPKGAELKFELYRDAAHTQIVESASGSGAPTGITFAVPAGEKSQRTIRLYGRIPANQEAKQAGDYAAGLQGSSISWTWNRGVAPASCSGSGAFAGTATAGEGAAGGAHVNVPADCRIATVDEMKFSDAPNLSTSLYQTAEIRIRCMSGVQWNLGLGDGANAQGSTRRMKGARSGQFIAYELYRNRSRQARWGTTVDVDTRSGYGAFGDTTIMTVFGLVPAQAGNLVPSDDYSDTVKVVLTF